MAKRSVWKVYFADELFPVTPGKIETSRSGGSSSASLIDGTSINILKAPGLMEFSMTLLFPNQKYPFASYEDGFKKAGHYWKLILDAQESREAKSLTITRKGVNGKILDGVDMEVSVESVSALEDAESTGFDKQVTVKFKQHVDYGTKTFSIPQPQPDTTQAATPDTKRDDSTAPKGGGSYTVAQGDTLWAIAKKYYGNGAQYTRIYQANAGTIEAAAKAHGKASSQGGHWIWPGETLAIPT